MSDEEKKATELKKTNDPLAARKARRENRFKIDRETAVDEFEELCYQFGINYETQYMNDENKEGFETQKELIIFAIRDGRLSVNDNGTLNFVVSNTPEKNGDVLIVKRPKGECYTRLNEQKKKDTVKQSFALLAAMIDKSVGYIMTLDGIDLKPLQAVEVLFTVG